jgi:hypothetical protein
MPEGLGFNPPVMPQPAEIMTNSRRDRLLSLPSTWVGIRAVIGQR